MAEPIIKLELFQAPESIGSYLSQAGDSKACPPVKISCADGRLLENKLLVGLVFYNILKDSNWGMFPESGILMPQHSVGEVSQMFSDAFNQDFRNVGTVKKEVSEYEENVEVKLEQVDVIVKVEEGEHYVELNAQTNIENVTEDDKKLFCGISPKSSQIKRHIQKKHFSEEVNQSNVIRNEFKYFCTICEFVSKRSDHLRRHIDRIHTKKDENATIYACANCSYTSTVQENFKRHAKTLCLAKVVKCLFCDKKSWTKEGSRVHIRRNHAEEWKKYKKEKNECLTI